MGSSLKLWPHDDSIFHHEAHVFHHRNIVERVAVNSDDIGEKPGLELSDLAFPAEEHGSINHVGLQHRQRLHAVLDHEFQLARLRPVRKWTYVGTHGELYPGSNLLL